MENSIFTIIGNRMKHSRTCWSVAEIEDAKALVDAAPATYAYYQAHIKCGPLPGGSYLGKPGVIPAWHMNKSRWIGLLLDGSAEDDTVRELLEISYDTTEGKI